MPKAKKSIHNIDFDIDTRNFLENKIFLGDRGVLFPELKKAIKTFFETQDVFDRKEVLFFEVEKLNISVDDVRRMISFATKTHEGTKIVMLSSFYWGSSAQNAMLKILEEPPVNTKIFLFGLNKKVFLQTIISRAGCVNFKNTNRYLAIAEEILKLHPNQRLEEKNVKKILGLKVIDYNYEKDTELEKKDREAHILFLYALLEIIIGFSHAKKNIDTRFLQKIYKISTLAEIEGGSPHLFIEWLLLSAPTISE